MSLPVVRLLADGGDITVGRRVSTFIYGVMNVTLADGVVGEEPEKTGLEEGYIVRADGDVPTGRFDFGFTRHDASMHMGLHTSDMEQGIVAASRRVEGGVFFERDIEPGGFGRWTPGVDFRVGDVVGVVRWGRVIPLPVTALNLRDGRWVAHVGGQMIHDAEKLRSQNQSIEKTIADERRQRAKENKDQSRRIDAESDARRRAVADVDAKAVAAGDAAKVADDKAKAAQATADDADGKAKKLAEALSGGGATIPTVMADLQRLNRQLQQNGEGGAADQGLIPAYIAANTKRWELQAELDRQQDALAEANRKATDANTAALKAQEALALAEKRENRLRPKMSTAFQSDWLNEPYTTPDGMFLFETDKKSLDRGFYITALGDWVGQIAVFVSNVDFANNAAGTEILLGTVTKTARRGFYKATRLVGASQVVVLTIPSE
ncbi:hypothetical protein [Corynebacterium macclintockiae]|uniref:hypothetical protein n=1 Tax=Corynebacterium macclintockiae TaxID=2913501 RepID=UPI003EBB611C